MIDDGAKLVAHNLAHPMHPPNVVFVKLDDCWVPVAPPADGHELLHDRGLAVPEWTHPWFNNKLELPHSNLSFRIPTLVPEWFWGPGDTHWKYNTSTFDWNPWADEQAAGYVNRNTIEAQRKRQKERAEKRKMNKAIRDIKKQNEEIVTHHTEIEEERKQLQAKADELKQKEDNLKALQQSILQDTSREQILLQDALTQSLLEDTTTNTQTNTSILKNTKRKMGLSSALHTTPAPKRRKIQRRLTFGDTEVIDIDTPQPTIPSPYSTIAATTRLVKIRIPSPSKITIASHKSIH
eukprot:802408_1